MSTPIRNLAPAPFESQLLAGLHLALGALSTDLTARLVAVLHAQLGATKLSPRMVEKVVVDSVPVLLQQAFVTSVMSDEEDARKYRAFLAHALSAAELQATAGKDLSALVQAAGASEAAATVDDELKSEEASRLLHVSRTHVNTLADSGAFGVVRRTCGGHRRISRTALLSYKALSRERQSKGLDAMSASSQKLGLYDAELLGLPVKAGR